MGLFDIFKSKKTPIQELFEKMSNQMFPKGERDINAGVNELLNILDYKTDASTARNILIKSMSLSEISETFDEERLKVHLSGYCLHLFNSNQINKFFIYITSLKMARILNRKTPSEVYRVENGYSW